jgi:hypothetical protein
VGQSIHILLDTGAMGNFINTKYIRVKEITLRNKKKPYTLGTLDNSDIGNIIKETY